MLHSERRWSLAEVESVEALAILLTRNTWTLCSGFVVKGHVNYLFLNDATHEDGAFEVGVVKQLADGSYLQVESITMSWCSFSEAKQYISDTLTSKFDASEFAFRVHPRIDPPGMHRNCRLCA